MLLYMLTSLLWARALSLTSEEATKFSSVVTVSKSGSQYTFKSNSLPSHAYGPFPSKDNPNSAEAVDTTFSFVESPTKNDDGSCMPMGVIGMAVNGVAFYNPYTIDKLDAVENEVMDDCGGHPSPTGQYHYHQTPDCVYSGGNNELVGVALDGFPIYGRKDENGNELFSADLDQCHGRDYNGQYQYHLTKDFPYILGCFRGSVTLNNQQQNNCEMAVADNYDGDTGSGSASRVAGLAVLISSMVCLMMH